MSTNIGDIAVRVGADIEPLQRGMRSAGQSVKGFEAVMNRSAAVARRFGIAVAAAAGAASGALIVMTQRSMQNIDAQAKLARAVGGTTAAMQGLTRAGDRAGVQSSELASAATRLNQRLGEVISTGKGADATFKAIGMTASQLANMDVDERFAAIADAMKRAGMSSQEMSFHLRNLGIRQASVITLIQGGGDEIRRSRQMVEDFGVAVSEVDAAQIERANDAAQEVGRVFEGLANQLAVKIAPHIERFSNQFTELAKAGGPLRGALDNVVAAAGRLMDVLSQESTVNAFAASISGLFGLVSSMADGLVWLTQNLELFTAAASAAAVALAVLGGPISLLVVALGAAAAGIVTLRARQRDLVAGADAAKVAQEALNKALGIFHETGAPSAAAEALTLALAYEEEARMALQAAEANYELARARLAAISGFQVDADGLAQGMTNPSMPGIAQEYADAAANVRMWESELISASRTVADLRSQINSGPTGGGGVEGAGAGGGVSLDPTTSALGAGSSKKVADEFAQRLEALQQGLMSEHEVLQEWYEQGIETLREARARELLTEEEYWDAKAKLQEEYTRRSQELMREELQARQQTFSMMSGLLSQFGQTNKKAAKAAQALGQFEAMVNAYRAASQVLADPTLPWFAKAQAAASTLAAGIGFANSIKGMSSSGSVSGGGSFGGSGASGAQQAPAPPTQTVIIDAPMDLSQFIKMANEASKRGYLMRFEQA
jgi:hypothetical protein